jgi:hypothetical protein
MRFGFFSAGPSHARQHQCPALKPLEDHYLPSATLMPASLAAIQSLSASTPLAAVNTIASLPHDQIHVLKDQSQQQTARPEVEQFVLGILQQLAPQAPLTALTVEVSAFV